MVCGGDAKECTSAKADLSLAPEIVLKVGPKPTEIKFTHEDYVYFKDDALNCRFGGVYHHRFEEICSSKTQVVLGKLFFEKYTPLLNVVNETGAASITFISHFKAPKERVVAWLIVGIVAACFAVLALIFTVLKRKKHVEGVSDSFERAPELIEKLNS